MCACICLCVCSTSLIWLVKNILRSFFDEDELLWLKKLFVKFIYLFFFCSITQSFVSTTQNVTISNTRLREGGVEMKINKRLVFPQTMT